MRTNGSFFVFNGRNARTLQLVTLNFSNIALGINETFWSNVEQVDKSDQRASGRYSDKGIWLCNTAIVSWVSTDAKACRIE